MSSSISTESLWIDTPQGRLFCCRWFPAGEVQRAKKPPVVLFHDSLGCIALWRDFPQLLSQATGREVIAYDRLGFGRSDVYPGTLPLEFIRDEAERFFAWVKTALQLDRFVALGHSVGGGMAAACASIYPQQCTVLITIAAQAFVEDRTLQGIREAEAQFENPAHMARLEKYHADKAPWVLGAWTKTWLAPAFNDWKIESAIDEIRCPTLVLHGEHDEYGSVKHPEHIATLSKGPSECLILDGCHHVPHREASEVVVAVVGKFLAERGQ
ncbi:alpha/beta fold hydrolase [Pseudomonas arcuscaelestis]|uniref:alpha/beta fold hydrolase n=1 Tax=Pseudomonas arcuscaelestis TaxID=2710591 RepID=UPI00193D3BE2|nr:alpha/beta hydrolase [Pseudomonas arcuscaelestis]MBM3112086.1 alpha/beta hydrolase [Pseudomonas arcuscaelestis]